MPQPLLPLANTHLGHGRVTLLTSRLAQPSPALTASNAASLHDRPQLSQNLPMLLPAQAPIVPVRVSRMRPVVCATVGHSRIVAHQVYSALVWREASSNTSSMVLYLTTTSLSLYHPKICKCLLQVHLSHLAVLKHPRQTRRPGSTSGPLSSSAIALVTRVSSAARFQSEGRASARGLRKAGRVAVAHRAVLSSVKPVRRRLS
jgi:hypothetical protein